MYDDTQVESTLTTEAMEIREICNNREHMNTVVQAINQHWLWPMFKMLGKKNRKKTN